MYIILEIQKNANGTVGELVFKKPTIEEAQSQFHTVMAAAAVSQCPAHSAVLLDDEGGVLRSECFTHSQPESDPEPEQEA